MLTKLSKSPTVFFLFVLTISVVFPIIGGVLQDVSCPGPAGLAHFPIISARCLGEFIGDIGVFCFGLPGLVVSFAIMSLISTLIKSFNDIFSPVIQLRAIAVLGLILNFVIYFFGLRLAMRPRQELVKIKKTP